MSFNPGDLLIHANRREIAVVLGINEDGNLSVLAIVDNDADFGQKMPYHWKDRIFGCWDLLTDENSKEFSYEFP
jgi:hypothetical protein